MTISTVAILTIAHDHGCTLFTTGVCGGDCDPTRKLLIGDFRLPLPGVPAPIHWEHRLARLRAGIEANKIKGEFV